MLSIILSLLLVFATAGGGVSAARCGDDGNGFDPHGQPCTTAGLDTDEGNGFDPHG